VNFARDLFDVLPPQQRALVELARDGRRREWSFGEVADFSARLAGTLAHRGVRRGDVVMTLIGNRPEWVLTMLACFRLGAVVLPCTEQLRAKDLSLDTAKMKLLTDPERVLAHVVALKVEEEKPAEVAATEAATPAEPEVIKKGKKEVEGEEGAEGKAEAKPEKAEKGEKKK